MKWLILVVLAVGCSSPGSREPRRSGATETDAPPPTMKNIDAAAPDSGGTCYSSPTSNVPECASLELCVTSTPYIDVDARNCSPGQCSWMFQSDAGDTLTYENDQGWLFLRFDGNSLAGVHDTAGLAAVFQHVNFYSKFPVKGSSSGAIYFENRQGTDRFDVFEFTEGRVHVKLTFSIQSPYVTLLSRTAFCGDTNSCSCWFDGYHADTSFEVDLPFQASFPSIPT